MSGRQPPTDRGGSGRDGQEGSPPLTRRQRRERERAAAAALVAQRWEQTSVPGRSEPSPEKQPSETSKPSPHLTPSQLFKEVQGSAQSRPSSPSRPAEAPQSPYSQQPMILSRPTARPGAEPAAEPAGASRTDAPAATSAAAVGTGSGGSRFSRRRRRLLAAMLVALVVLTLGAGGVWWSSSERDEPTPAEPAEVEQQRTTFVAVTTREGDVVAGIVLAEGERTTALLVPSRLLVDVAGQGRVVLADALDTGPSAPGQAVADLVGLRVDGSWVLTLDGLVALVDRANGVVVDVDVPVTTSTGQLSVGTDKRLDGVEAATFAGWLQQNEAETARLARVEQVLSQVLAGLPEGTNAVGSTLSELGDDSVSTFDPLELAERVDAVATDIREGRYGATVLPTTTIATDDDVVYGLDADAADTVLDERFAGARSRADADAVRVLVQNGDGSPGLGERARERLVEEGFRYVGGGNAASLGTPTTVVAVHEDTPEAREQGLAVAQALGLGPEVLAVGLEQPTLADVVVVLGADFAAVAAKDG